MPPRLAALAALDSLPYVVDTVAAGLRTPWSLAFLPDGGMLVTEKYGGIRLYRKGGSSSDTLTGIPRAFQFEDAGLLDVALDPETARWCCRRFCCAS